MISFSCKARSGCTDSSINYIANSPRREKKRRTIWHNSFLNLQKQALIARTEMFFWKKIFFKTWAQQAELLRHCHRGVNAIEGKGNQGRLLTPETSSGNKTSLIWMKNNEQCITSLSLGHNLGLCTCNQPEWETLSFVWAKSSCLTWRDWPQWPFTSSPSFQVCF